MLTKGATTVMDPAQKEGEEEPPSERKRKLTDARRREKASLNGQKLWNQRAWLPEGGKWGQPSGEKEQLSCERTFQK